MELDRIYNIDCLEGLRQLDDNSVDVVITSPPYNKIGLRGGRRSINSNQTWCATDINYDGFSDDVDEEEYQRWQIEILNEIQRVLKPDGTCFYNHKDRQKDHRTYSPLEWILKSNLNYYQLIIWDRGGSCQRDPCRFLPSTEFIYFLTKSACMPNFKRRNYLANRAEVWKISADFGNEHPAPFPLALPDNILAHITDDGKEGGLVVVDPFMGSGTTAIAAIKNRCHYIGFEHSPKYVKMAEERIINEQPDMTLF